MSPREKEKLERDTYDFCLSYHALNWMKNHQGLNSTAYLEMNGGPIMAYFIQQKGVAQVLMDLDKKIENVLN